MSDSPIPQVTVNGKTVDTSAIDNYDSFMLYLTQAAAAAHLSKIRRIEEDRQSKGKTLPIILNVTQAVLETPAPEPCQCLYIENQGLVPIFVCLNAIAEAATLIPAGRDAVFEFPNHIIERFYVWTAPATVSTAEAILSY